MHQQNRKVQLGQCLQKLIATIVENYDKNTLFKFTKIDIKDGFWRLSVSDIYAWNFCYVIPQAKKEKYIECIKVMLPNCLQWGGVNHHCYYSHHQKQQDMSLIHYYMS